MKQVITAGGVVIKNTNDKFLILLIKHKNGGLLFPKGHVKDGEGLEEAALREVREETGLRNLSIFKKIGVVSRLSVEDSGERVIKKIHLFLMKSENFNHQEADEEYGWFSFENALSLMKFKEEKDFLEKHWEKSFKS